MEYQYLLASMNPQVNGNIDIIIARELLNNGKVIVVQAWNHILVPSADLSSPLPCQWEGDTEITPLSWDQFPAEKQYILAKWAEIN